MAVPRGTAPAAEAFRQEVKEGAASKICATTLSDPSLPRKSVPKRRRALRERLGRFRSQLRLSTDAGDGFDFAVRPLPDLSYSEDVQARLDRLKSLSRRGRRPGRCLICAESAGRRELLRETLARGGLAVSAVSDLEAFFAEGLAWASPSPSSMVSTSRTKGSRSSRRRTCWVSGYSNPGAGKKGAGDAPELIVRGPLRTHPRGPRGS